MGVLRPCRRIVDTTGLCTNENEDPAAHIASTLKFRSSFASLMRTTGKPSLCDVFFYCSRGIWDTVVASLFEKSLCRSFLRRRPQLGTLQVLLCNLLTNGQVSGNWNIIWISWIYANILVVHSVSLISNSCKTRWHTFRLRIDILNSLVLRNHQRWMQNYLFGIFSSFETWRLSRLTSILVKRLSFLSTPSKQSSLLQVVNDPAVVVATALKLR